MNDLEQQRQAEIARLRHEIDVAEQTLKRCDDDQRLAEQDFITRGTWVTRTVYDSHNKPIEKQCTNPSISIIGTCTNMRKKITKRLTELRAALKEAEEKLGMWSPDREKWIKFKERTDEARRKQDEQELKNRQGVNQ